MVTPDSQDSTPINVVISRDSIHIAMDTPASSSGINTPSSSDAGSVDIKEAIDEMEKLIHPQRSPEKSRKQEEDARQHINVALIKKCIVIFTLCLSFYLLGYQFGGRHAPSSPTSTHSTPPPKLNAYSRLPVKLAPYPEIVIYTGEWKPTAEQAKMNQVHRDITEEVDGVQDWIWGSLPWAKDTDTIAHIETGRNYLGKIHVQVPKGAAVMVLRNRMTREGKWNLLCFGMKGGARFKDFGWDDCVITDKMIASENGGAVLARS
ncbi:hypothetical protein BJ508DRAFT_302149 [Ascobolus immersus RN42]|uniref:Uncharacterized protein n=1 Tax=Ascobolus immersus RN42 TaxID=1160509 RepID=A0A3N4IJC0_ASCIM|nr:hypothetical protein BJ508DRAFT_302149 [Ascobolus immersus RN42]